VSKKKYTISVDRPRETPGFIDDYIKKLAVNKAKIYDIDAELNGALMPVANILGHQLYMRVDHHDPEKANHDLQEVKALVKDMVYPED
jgi:hypothetical protein